MAVTTNVNVLEIGPHLIEQGGLQLGALRGA
jgi:hypothetical protein